MTSSSADCTLAGARLISSASSRLPKTGPSSVWNSPVSGRQMRVPTRSAGTRSGVNCTRLKEPPSTRASVRMVSVLARPGTPSSRTWPPTSSATSSFSSIASWPMTTRLVSNRTDSSARRGSRRRRLASAGPAGTAATGTADGSVMSWRLGRGRQRRLSAALGASDSGARDQLVEVRAEHRGDGRGRSRRRRRRQGGVADAEPDDDVSVEPPRVPRRPTPGQVARSTRGREPLRRRGQHRVARRDEGEQPVVGLRRPSTRTQPVVAARPPGTPAARRRSPRAGRPGGRRCRAPARPAAGRPRAGRSAWANSRRPPNSL